METFSERELSEIKAILTDLAVHTPDLPLVDYRGHKICALDLASLRWAFEEKLGIDVDEITVKNALDKWNAVFSWNHQ